MRKYKGLAGLVLALVFIAAATPSEAQLFGRKNDESAVRISQLEERIRALTGQIEQLSYQMRELQDQMRRMQEDNEYRFQQLEGGTPGQRSDAAPGSVPGAPAPGNSAPGLGPDGTPQTGSLIAPGGGFATVPADGSGDGNWDQSGGYEGDTGLPSNGPIDLSKLATGLENLPGSGQDAPDPGLATDDDQIANIIGTGDPRSDYEEAYSMAVNGNYAEAEHAFRTFLENYPDDALTANAQYWLGESLLAQQNYREAADAFLKTYTDHPGNSKSPDSLLKLGVSLRGLGEADAACATFSELLNKYPDAAPAVLSQARDERRRAQCS
ncbi:tol-pal system protein YbgF [Roseibium salinum]|uniref:Cell division coordinator CpoB n=1 Tax=Roseibium salinum TaxID=1604349 RepID=A0ABT3R8B9_9HYPH|nr:tol-pal system protein YbgF [Roseibium sp. DSM 29163]MCX2725402.1 tol-pal system protein YbgF [Roseibium sp. DSM 29163]